MAKSEDMFKGVFRDTEEPLAAPMALQKPESIAQVQVILCGAETYS